MTHIINITKSEIKVNPATFQPEIYFEGKVGIEPMKDTEAMDGLEQVYRNIGENVLTQITDLARKSL